MDVEQLISHVSSQNLLHCSVNFSFTNLQQALLDLTNALSLAHTKIQNLEQFAERSSNQEERLREEVIRIQDELLIRPSYDEVKKEASSTKDQHQKFMDRIDNSLTFINSDLKMVNHRGNPMLYSKI
jgi:chromosome segregation ATPase